jgi:4'-phosphopantetheinyl transferase
MVYWLGRGEDAALRDGTWLAPGEAARAADLRFTKRRDEYLLRRLTAKCAVAATAGLPCDAATLARIEVRNAATGAPFVLIDGAACALDVSISDRAGWAVCLVGTAGRDRAIGCDLELIEPRTPGFVHDFLTESERSYVAAQPVGEARQIAANLLWSAKESALKVLRTGLRRDPRSVEVSVPRVSSSGWAPLAVRVAESATFAGWWRRDGRFLLTAVAEPAVPAPVALEGVSVLAGAEPRHSWLDMPRSG